MKKKSISIIVLFLCISFIPIGAFAHSGNTDSAGGHHDYQNASGLGYYHYHHGYGPHLHPNGVCPYANNNNAVYVAAPVSNTKKAVITSGSVKINGNTVNNASLKYPLISYNNITYFPLTYRNKVSLGLTHESKYGDIYITTGNTATYTADIEGTSTIGKAVTATIQDSYLYVNGRLYFYDDAWPLLRYSDIIYIPMTYDFAHTLNLDISWSQEKGLAISSRKPQVPTQPTQVQPQTKPVQQSVKVTEPVIQFQPVDTSARPVLNKNSVYYVFSLEKPSKYLGKVSSDFYSEDSIFNMTGMYGDYDAETSIWNTYSRYGSSTSEYSARNIHASYPPAIVDINGKLYGFLTYNDDLDSPAAPAYSPAELMRIFM